MQYRDFNIRVLGKSAEGFHVQVDSPAGSERAHIELDVDDIENYVNQIGGIVRSAATRETEFDVDQKITPTELGGRLYDALFTGGIRTMYDRSCGEVLADPEMGLRIKLHIDLEDPELASIAQLPWEFAYERSAQEYLALGRQTPLVRYVEVPKRLNSYKRKGKLRVLVLISSPADHAPLDLERERRLIEESWARDSDVEVDFLEHPTRLKLQDALEDKAYHVLHFMGHGAYDASSRAGALVIEDDNGNADLLNAQTIKVWLRDVPSLRLIFLNACNTGKADQDEPFSGVANSLVLAGLPAVVAMQFPVSDNAAIDFSRRFYSRLVKGAPVDEAVTLGRKAIYGGPTGAMEWATPVLYMRAPDGNLFTEGEGANDSTTSSQELPRRADPAIPPEISAESPENTISTLSVFLAVLFVTVAGFSAYRHSKFDDPPFLSIAAVILTMIGVGLILATCSARYSETQSPRYNSLLAFLIGNLGVHAAFIFGPLIHVVSSTDMAVSDYYVTLFIGVVGSAIFAAMLFYQQRAAAWVYAMAPAFATFVVLGHVVSIGKQFVEAFNDDDSDWWTDDKFAYLHLLIVTASFSAILISAAYLAANKKFSARTAG